MLYMRICRLPFAVCRLLYAVCCMPYAVCSAIKIKTRSLTRSTVMAVQLKMMHPTTMASLKLKMNPTMIASLQLKTWCIRHCWHHIIEHIRYILCQWEPPTTKQNKHGLQGSFTYYKKLARLTCTNLIIMMWHHDLSSIIIKKRIEKWW